MQFLAAACLLIVATSPVMAQRAKASETEVRAVEIYRSVSLAAGTPIELEMADAVTTQDRTLRKGDAFELVVSQHVLIGEYVVIPKGTRASGHVRAARRPGAFGRSGKIEIEIDHLFLGGKKVALTGEHRAEGRGDLTSLGSVAAAGPFAAFIQGDDGKIERGSGVTAYLAESLGVILPFRPHAGTRDTGYPMMVRARRIDVSEAFRDVKPPSPIVTEKVSSAQRISVAEAFSKEL